ncbi:hypothetical protein B0H19DRAFT_1248278 [Mycena capillaripes]|nr:hypothetical protein B0H19DRAFT_1248278 [Mycena capillaripes]
MFHQPANEVFAAIPTYRRTLSPNELSYFLPSRAYGLNDMCSRMIIHAPPHLISPLRIRIVWAILRLRHSLMASRVEMAPGCYEDAQFVYTPPSSPSQALAEVTPCVRMRYDIRGPELLHAYLNGPRTLSSEYLTRLDIACHGEVSPGVHEFTPFSPSSSYWADDEWTLRWGASRDATHDAIVPATETRVVGRGRSKFQEVAWKVDNQNNQKRLIGGHVFPRTKSLVLNVRLIQAKFDPSQTAAIFTKCKARGITAANAGFALCNFAWMRLCAAHPEIDAPKDLPMLMYTAIGLRRYLKPTSPLQSYMSLALEYYNVMLPTFLPADADPHKMFWARAREAQRQMFKYSHSPLMLQRAMVTNATRGERAKAWARIDDETDGALPPTPRAAPPPPPPGPKPVQSVALLGLSQSGDADAIYRTEKYPLIKLIDAVGGARRAPGGLSFYTRKFLGKFHMSLLWDAAPFAPGLIEEFWGYLVDGMHEYVLEDPSLKGTAEVMDCLARGPQKAKGKL